MNVGIQRVVLNVTDEGVVLQPLIGPPFCPTHPHCYHRGRNQNDAHGDQRYPHCVEMACHFHSTGAGESGLKKQLVLYTEIHYFEAQESMPKNTYLCIAKNIGNVWIYLFVTYIVSQQINLRAEEFPRANTRWSIFVLLYSLRQTLRNVV